jgi:hypothetical protein
LAQSTRLTQLKLQQAEMCSAFIPTAQRALDVDQAGLDAINQAHDQFTSSITSLQVDLDMVTCATKQVGELLHAEETTLINAQQRQVEFQAKQARGMALKERLSLARQQAEDLDRKAKALNEDIVLATAQREHAKQAHLAAIRRECQQRLDMQVAQLTKLRDELVSVESNHPPTRR